MPERTLPPLRADERTTLEAWLDYYRATLLAKTDGLSEGQLRTASAPPSPITLLGLVQHAAEVERNWFRRVLAAEPVPAIFDPQAPTDGDDGGFDLTEDVTGADARVVWEREVAHARRNCAGRDLDATSPLMGGEVTLRWIYVHVTAEYARHCGHADLVRERIDGATGV